MSDIFNTVFQATYNRQTARINQMNEWRQRELLRRDEVNVATNNALANALAQVNTYQKTLTDREVRLAQAQGQATGKAPKAATPAARAAGRVGADQRQAEVQDATTEFGRKMTQEQFKELGKIRRQEDQQEHALAAQQNQTQLNLQLEKEKQIYGGATPQTVIDLMKQNERKPTAAQIEFIESKATQNRGIVPSSVVDRLVKQNQQQHFNVDARSYNFPKADSKTQERLLARWREESGLEMEVDDRLLELDLPASIEGLPSGWKEKPPEEKRDFLRRKILAEWKAAGDHRYDQYMNLQREFTEQDIGRAAGVGQQIEEGVGVVGAQEGANRLQQSFDATDIDAVLGD